MVAHVTVEQFHPTVPVGEVIAQDPPAGEITLDTETITIYVSLGSAAAGGFDVSPGQLTISGGEISMRLNYGATYAHFVERQSIAVMRAA